MPLTFFWGGGGGRGGGGGGGGGGVGVFLGVAEQLTSGDNVGKEILFCFVWLFTW